MKKAFIRIFLFGNLFLSSCTSVQYTQFPARPLSPEKVENMVIMPFEHPDYHFSVFANFVIVENMNEIECFHVLPFDSVADDFYRYIIDPNLPLTLEQMARLHNKTGMKYLMKGTYVSESPGQGIHGPTLYEDEAGFYYPGQMDEGRWQVFAFEIYDLEAQAVFYRLDIKVSATATDVERDTHEYQRIYSPAALVMNSTTLNKSMKRIKKAFKADK